MIELASDGANIISRHFGQFTSNWASAPHGLHQMLEWKQLYHRCALGTAWVRRRPFALITLHNSDGVLTRCLSIPLFSQEYLPHAIKHSWHQTIGCGIHRMGVSGRAMCSERPTMGCMLAQGPALIRTLCYMCRRRVA